ncbi:MAG: Fic family protein [Reyranellales bacterium]
MRRDDLAGPIQRQLKRLPEPYGNHYGVVALRPPEEAVRLSKALPRLREATAALAKVNTLAAELQDPFILSRIIARREAVSSSAIEGTNSTLDELLSIEESDSDDHIPAAAAQVRDYARVLEHFLPRAQREGPALFDVPLVQELHRQVMKNDPDYQDEPGALRSVVVWIGGRGNIANSTYTPAPPAEVVPTLAESIDYLRCEGLQTVNQHLITRMAVAHAHFEAVHPFRDGNGRVGRLLLPLMMAAEGQIPLYLSPYIEAHKDDYYASLKAAQQRLDWDRGVGFLSDAVTSTVSELMTTRDALKKLGDLWQGRYKFRRGSAALRALAILPHYPVVTTKRLMTLLQVSPPVALEATNRLVSLGILKERTGYQRNRVFISPEALTIINRPFGAPPILPERT